MAEMVVAGVMDGVKTVLLWVAIMGVVVGFVGTFIYMRGRDQVTSPAHQFVVACRAVDGTPFQSADGTLSCFSAPGAGKVLK